MTEKMQHTAHSMAMSMKNRYDDGQHKHDKNHLKFRQHFKTHPSNPNILKDALFLNQPTGLIRNFKLRKLRTRFAKGISH